MKIKKAIITAGGIGTRFLPVTKTIQKEMLPILNKPIIDYLVDDCVNAGVEEIIFVVNEQNIQIQHYYEEDLGLKRYLEHIKKAGKYEKVAKLHTKAKFSFVKQKETDPYGTGVPVLLARKHVENEEAFLVLMGDDYIYNQDGSNEIVKMIETFNKSQAKGLLTCVLVANELVNKYGIVEFREENGFKILTNQVEKPQKEEVSSNFANISKYIFTPAIFQFIENNEIDIASGELFITTACTKFAQNNRMVIHETKGKYLDSGYVLGWLKANLVYARDKKELWPELKEFMKEMVDTF